MADEVWVALPSPLAGPSILVMLGQATIRARTALSTPLGAPSSVCNLAMLVQVAASSPLGVIRALVYTTGVAWVGDAPAGTAGCASNYSIPRRSDYTYQKDAGLERTSMLSGVTRQRRKWRDGRRTATVSFEVPTADLYEMEAWVAEYGYDWFTMRLVTGDNTGLEAEPHIVRIMADPSYGDVYGENITITLSIEVQNSPVVCPEPEPDEPACLWCGVPYNYTTWDAEEDAWVGSGSQGGLYEFIRPVQVDGVDWWKDPRPDSLTLQFKTGPGGGSIYLHINTENDTVATVDLTTYDSEVWHTITFELDWDIDPTGNLAVISVESYIYGEYELKLRICHADTGEMCTGGY